MGEIERLAGVSCARAEPPSRQASPTPMRSLCRTWKLTPPEQRIGLR